MDGSNSTITYWIEKWPYAPVPLEVAVVASVISAILGVFGAVTNALVMFLISRIKRSGELENMDILVLSLCFSDFFTSTAIPPQLIPRLLARIRVSATQLFWLHVTTHTTLTLGCLNLLMVTFDRYFSINFPFRYAAHVTKTKCYICLVFVWTVTSGMAVFSYVDGKTESQVYPVLTSIAFTLTIILQAMIWRIVRAQNRNVQQQVEAVQHNQAQVTNDFSHMTRQSNASGSNTNTTVFFMNAVFIVTWLPSVIFRLNYVIDGDTTYYLQWVHIFSVVLQLHSCINPYIYVLRTARIRRIFVGVFGRTQ